MTGGRAFLIRADHGHMVAAGSRCQGQSFDAIGKHAVVITDQDPQRGHGMPEGSGGNLSVAAAYSQFAAIPKP